jgi:hypothetical protein
VSCWGGGHSQPAIESCDRSLVYTLSSVVVGVMEHRYMSSLSLYVFYVFFLSIEIGLSSMCAICWLDVVDNYDYNKKYNTMYIYPWHPGLLDVFSSWVISIVK